MREGYMKIEFKRLTEVDRADIIGLMNHPRLRQHMPLLGDTFGEAECNAFIAGKEALWTEHGYGPWAFFVDGHFVGWGGLQPEDGDADLALVLHPNSWGMGKAIYDKIIERAFGVMGFESVTVLLPPTRVRVRGLQRLGFEPDGEVEYLGERFLRYRLHESSK
jgi:[ribosomal protein S5]-alanine N-acetyltransferase